MFMPHLYLSLVQRNVKRVIGHLQKIYLESFMTFFKSQRADGKRYVYTDHMSLITAKILQLQFL